MLEVAIEVERPRFHLEIELSVADGERLALFGPSGAGKTTILEVIAGLVVPGRGRVALAGRELTHVAGRERSRVVPPHERRIGLLRQDPGLFPHLTARENLLYSPAARELDDAIVEATAAALELTSKLEAYPRRLSGGQAHRVALARLLLARPDALLLDEPHTGLDARLRKLLTGIVRRECRLRSVPGVLVSHGLDDAQAFADRLAVIDDGHLLQVGPPSEVVRQPATRRVAELVGYSGFVSGRPDFSDCSLGIHPDRVRRGSHPDNGVVIEGVIEAVRPKGASFEVDLTTGDCTLSCVFPDDPPTVGDPVIVTVVDPPFFDQEGRLVRSTSP